MRVGALIFLLKLIINAECNKEDTVIMVRNFKFSNSYFHWIFRICEQPFIEDAFHVRQVP